MAKTIANVLTGVAELLVRQPNDPIGRQQRPHVDTLRRRQRFPIHLQVKRQPLARDGYHLLRHQDLVLADLLVQPAGKPCRKHPVG